MSKKKVKIQKILFVGKGDISGTYADSFHSISFPDGKIGYDNNREPTFDDCSQILSDLERHRNCLLKELRDLSAVELLISLKLEKLQKPISDKTGWVEF